MFYTDINAKRRLPFLETSDLGKDVAICLLFLLLLAHHFAIDNIVYIIISFISL